MKRQARVLVCPPTHFRVVYEINPWMNVCRQPDHGLAQRQWHALKAVVEAYADPVAIEPVPDAPDMVFTANAGFVHRGRVLLSRFRHRQRRIEVPHFRRWFERRAFELLECPQDLCFEGAGDALKHPDAPRIWLGYGIRSDLEALIPLQRAFCGEIVPLRLVSPSFYHLDTCFCPLPAGAVMYYPGAFDAEARLRLYQLLPAERRIEVGAEDAYAFACNALVLGSTVILNRASEQLRERLARLGLEVRQCDVGEFMRAGGAVKCLTLPLDA